MPVQTVLGPIEASELGFTLPHEHLCCTSAGIWQSWPELLGGREHVVSTVTDRLSEAATETGLRTVVDLTTIDLGRDVFLLEEASKRSGVNIVACTGHHLAPSRSMIGRTADEMAGLFVREIEEGIDGTGVRAGIIKVANDVEGVDEFGERLLRAAARAHLRTGVPISTHTYAPGRVGERQLSIFEEEGVDPSRVYIGHSNDTTDLGYLEGLLKRGCWLGLDRYPGGLRFGPQWEERTQIVHELIERGYAGRLMLSHDSPLVSDRVPTAEMAGVRAYNPDGILFISRAVLPRLREMGTSDDVLSLITVQNPPRFLGGS